VEHSLLFLFGRPVSEHKLLWQPSDCIINFVLLTLLLHVGNKCDDDYRSGTVQCFQSSFVTSLPVFDEICVTAMYVAFFVRVTLIKM